MSESRNKSKVLVVDDSRVGLMHLVQILQETNEYIIHTASSGVEAVQVARVAKPDIILLDIVMPQLDGYETLTKLRETIETRDIPVIFITSLDQDENEEKGLRLGAVDYISKPYNPIIVKLRVSVQLKIVEQMRLIEYLGLTDNLTRVPNRRYFDQRLTEEWKRAMKEDRHLGILMLDVDKLRTFNTIHGYRQGDEVLCAIAEIISQKGITRPGDFSARWADGTFAILLQDADAAYCNTIGENIRVAVEEIKLSTTDGSSVSFTLSIGANAIKPSPESDMEQFVSNADAALYLAKELGRNQVVVHS